ACSDDWAAAFDVRRFQGVGVVGPPYDARPWTRSTLRLRERSPDDPLGTLRCWCSGTLRIRLRSARSCRQSRPTGSRSAARIRASRWRTHLAMSVCEGGRREWAEASTPLATCRRPLADGSGRGSLVLHPHRRRNVERLEGTG